MKKILDVTKVAFNGRTGDDRCPEDFAFPACMASLMEALGEAYPKVTLRAHDRAFVKRLANDQFLGASGMAFGLLWHPEHCMSAMDLTQANDHTETIRRAFAWAGYDYSLQIRGESGEDVWQAVVDSINRGVPALGFGLFDPPECAIVAGYDDQDRALIGWSHFQDTAGLPTEENGMFRLTGWEKDWWKIVLPGKKTEKTLSFRDAAAHGLSILKTEEMDGYLAGQSAYRAWINDILTINDGDPDEIRSRWNYHNSLLFNLAEARCWGGVFLREGGAVKAADCFQAIHDTCWEADGLIQKAGGCLCLGNENTRRALAEILGRIAALDAKAADCLTAYLAE